MEDIYRETVTAIENGANFRIDFQSRSLKVNGRHMIRNGRYDGAPWLPERLEGKMGNGKCILLKRFFYRLIGSPKLRRWKYFTYEVGNGGFSLRNISKMIAITREYKSKIAQWLDDEKPDARPPPLEF